MMGVKYQIIEGVIQLFPPSASLARSSHFFTLSELAILETKFRNIWQKKDSIENCCYDFLIFSTPGFVHVNHIVFSQPS